MIRWLFLLSLLFASQAVAAVSDEEFAELRQQLLLLSDRVDALEAENAELRQAQDVLPPVAAAPVPDSWSDRVGLDGDFRYRFEEIDAEGSPTRQRNRIRARVNLNAAVSEDVEVGFGLATGGDDPVSTNQTLGGGGSSKGVVLNLAYANWAVTDNLNIIAGKYKNPLYRAGKQQLMWDGDWTPEGLAFTYEKGWLFMNGFGNYLESDSRTGDKSFAWGAQVGATGSVGDVGLKGGVGFFSLDTKGKRTPFGDPSDAGDFFGNTAVEATGLACGTTAGADCFYRYDYILTEVFGEATMRIGDWPAAFFFDYVTNSDPSDENTAWTVGARIGQAKDRGQMEFGYLYVEKEADSVVGLVTDSDFAGGGTDNDGHSLQFKYGVNPNWTLGAQFFINETDISSGSSSDYNRFMLDTQWKWK